MKEIFTIGYSMLSPERFISLLVSNKISMVIDVRTTPKSKFYVWSDKEKISCLLKESGILYSHMPSEFGARQRDTLFFGPDGFLDFNLFSKSTQFQRGVNFLKRLSDEGERIAIMCAEKEPENCHRCILISHHLDPLEFSPFHILNDGTIKTQKQIDESLVWKYFSPNNQLSLFDEDNLTEEQKIKKAYEMQNKEIGFKGADLW